MTNLGVAIVLLLFLAYQNFVLALHIVSPPCHLPSTRHFAFMNAATGGNQPKRKRFIVERVASREHYYDLSVFRYRNTPLDEYLAKNNNHDQHHRSKEEALTLFTSTKCDDVGQDLWFSQPSQMGLLTQFVATIPGNSEDDSSERLPDKHHGVVGSIDALLREIHNRDGDSSIATVTVELKNLSVHPSFRRMGMASRLVDTVQAYAQELLSTAPTTVFLHVALDNHGARALYENKGFRAEDPLDLEKMVWNPATMN